VDGTDRIEAAPWTGPNFLEDNVEAVEQELRTPW
jgi:hypothetical protein